MKNLKRLLVVALTGLFLVFGVSSQVWSQASSETGSGLSISPTRTELLNLEPGTSDIVRVNLRNVTNGEITARAYINDFESNDETGEPQIIIDESRESATSIKPFVKGVEDVVLKGGESKTFDVAVEIPQDASPGAYFGVLRYEAIPAGSAAPGPGQVSLTASVSTIVLIQVPGDIREQIQVRDVHVYRKGIAGGFFAAKPEEVGVRVSNQGNGFIKPFGNVTVNNPLGKQVHSYELNNSDPRSNVLPSSERVFRNELKGVSVPGRYVVTANVSFGNGGEVLTLRKTFWYLPWWFILLIVLLIAAIAYGVYWARKKYFGAPKGKKSRAKRSKK